MTHIVVAGTIGAGKTTAVTLLARELGAPAYVEDYKSNPFLEAFYADPPRWALRSQLHFLCQTVDHHRRCQSGGGVQDHSPQEAHLGFDRLLHRAGTLSDDDFGLLNRTYRLLTAGLTPPDLTVVLRADTATLQRRIRERARPYEQHLDAAYLDDLAALKHDGYEDHDRVLFFDTGTHDLSTPDGASRLVDEVRIALDTTRRSA